MFYSMHVMHGKSVVLNTASQPARGRAPPQVDLVHSSTTMARPTMAIGKF